MADKLIGSLIHGEHVVPKKQRPLKERLKLPVAIGIALLLIGLVVYKFANYREERRVAEFLEDIRESHYEAAYTKWDAGGRYSMNDFMADWGRNGYYAKGLN